MQDNQSVNPVSETLPQSPRVINSSAKIYSVVLAVLLLFTVTASVYLFFQNKQLTDQLANPVVTTKPDLRETPATPPQPTVAGTPAQTDSVDRLSLPVVVFAPPLSTTENTQIRQLLISRVINPFIDYYNQTSQSDHYLSILIESQSDEKLKETYPYELTAITDYGGLHGELLTQKNGVIDWWIPVCQDCELSTDFRVKYPEIAKNFPITN